MRHSILALLLAAPFWQTKPVADWSIEEVRAMLVDSPWAQTVTAGDKSPAPAVQVYLATAEPVQAAEDRMRATQRKKTDDPSWDEYREYLVQNTGKYIVVAISIPEPSALSDNAETKHMEGDSQLKVGKRKYKVVGHFPPSSTDPFVRLVFPRDVQPGDKALNLELYVPGSGAPYRQCQFALKDMIYRGQPSY